jgi:hypothetical protein
VMNVFPTYVDEVNKTIVTFLSAYSSKTYLGPAFGLVVTSWLFSLFMTVLTVVKMRWL